MNPQYTNVKVEGPSFPTGMASQFLILPNHFEVSVCFVDLSGAKLPPIEMLGERWMKAALIRRNVGWLINGEL